MATFSDTPVTEYKRSNKKVIMYCCIVGLGAILFGIDQGETTGFLAMPRFVRLS